MEFQYIKKIETKLKLTPAFFRMVKALAYTGFAVHLIACFWYLGARYKNLDPDTWVARLSL